MICRAAVLTNNIQVNAPASERTPDFISMKSAQGSTPEII
jgi:hypothetical protein